MNDKTSDALLPSATVLLLRDGRDGLEVFMVVRHHKIDSFSGALVFPGGKCDPGDSDPVLREYCPRAGGLSDAMLSFHVAAVREAFEECGVLLARERGTMEMIGADRLADLSAKYRQPLLDDEIDMPSICRAENLDLAVNQMVHFAHWITPVVVPKRFDTHFFLAAAPRDHLAAHDGLESTDSVWIRPQDAMEEADAERRTVVFPTRMNLIKLARAATVEEALAQARAEPVVTVLPTVEPDAGAKTRVMNIPADAGYGASRVRVNAAGAQPQILE